MGRRLVDDFRAHVAAGKPVVTQALVAAVVTFNERVSAREDIIMVTNDQVVQTPYAQEKALLNALSRSSMLGLKGLSMWVKNYFGNNECVK